MVSPSFSSSLCVFFLCTRVVLAQANNDNEENGPLLISLTQDNYDATTKGRNVFLKFFDPQCAHCRSMAPAWTQLEDKWRHDPRVLVASVNCRQDSNNERWCDRDMNIHGLPTILYGEPSHGGAYLNSFGDDKTFAVMDQFVTDTLAVKPICSAGNTDACDADVKANLERYWTLSVSQLEKEIDLKRKDIKEINQTFKDEFAKMQKIYDDRSTEHEKEKARIKAKIVMLQSVVAKKS